LSQLKPEERITIITDEASARHSGRVASEVEEIDRTRVFILEITIRVAQENAARNSGRSAPRRFRSSPRKSDGSSPPRDMTAIRGST